MFVQLWYDQRTLSLTRCGYLSEHHSTGETALKVGDYADDMAMEMFATTIGMEIYGFLEMV
jgi:pyruvoyl-dependent arginine decarboxylase (PvlArgDC)